MQLTTDYPTDRLMPASSIEQIQRIASELNARTASLTQLIEVSVPDDARRDAIIAAQRGLQHELANMLTVLHLIEVRERAA